MKYIWFIIILIILFFSVMYMFGVLVLTTYLDEILIIQISYFILKIQCLTHKGLSNSCNDMYQVSGLSNAF
jgi:hypothetical protein